MQITTMQRGVDFTYLTIFLEDETQHYRIQNGTGLVQRRFGLAASPHWARTHPDRAVGILQAAGATSAAK